MNTKLVKRAPMMTIVASLITSLVGVASAQESEEAPVLVLEEIVVTARKREELLSDTPIAVTALTSQEIDAAGFEDIKDLAKATPGLVFEGFETNPGRFDSVPFVRGITFNAPSPIRQPVSVFIDGVYVAGGTSGIGVEDVQRIEVIKGPQSAQFGRATFAGAINYITVDPSAETRGRIGVTAASRGEYEITGSTEGQLAPGLTARLSGRFASKEGHYKNSLDESQTLGDEETMSAGLTLAYAPNDRFKARVRAFYSTLDDGPAAVALIDSTFNTGGFGGVETIFQGTLPQAPRIGTNTTNADFATFIADARDIGFNFIGGEPNEYGLDRESSRFSVDASYDFGNVTLSGILGINSEEGTVIYDTDTTPDAAYQSIAGREFDDTSAEIRLDGTAFNDRLTWGIGASKLEIDYDNNFSFGLQALGQSASFGARANSGASLLREVTTDAIFAQVGYALTDTLSLNIEVRDQEDEIDVRTVGNPDLTSRVAVFDAFLPRVTLDYKPSEDTLLYVSYSEGNLPGGFNNIFASLPPENQRAAQLVNPAASATFDEETLENIEIGWKQSFMDNRANLSVAAYKMDRTDQQTSAVIAYPNPAFGTDPDQPPIATAGVVLNAAASDIQGIEIEGNWLPSDNWRMRGTLAYTKAEISAFPASGDSGDFEDVFGTDEGFIGTAAPRYPEIQASLALTYTQPMGSTALGDNSSWYVRNDLFYQDEFFLTEANLGKAPSSLEANLRVGVRSDKWSIEAFITNLFDEDAPIAANNASDLSNATPLFSFSVEATQIGLRDKRQVGARATYSF